jgi:hypothetical protein
MNMIRFASLVLLASIVPTASLMAQCQTSTMTCQTTLASALTTPDCVAGDSSQYDLYQFAGTSGQTITIEMHSAAFDSYLGLIDPSGVPVADSDDLSSSSTDSKITWTLAATGTWTIMANSLAASKTGDYTLSLAGCGVTNTTRRRAVRAH